MNKKTKSQPKKKRGRSGETSSVKLYLISTAKSFVLFLILFAAAAFICYKADLSRENYFIIALAVCAVSSFLSGAFMSVKLKEKGIICGFLGALPLTAVTVISSLIAGGEVSAPLIAATCVAMMFLGTAGGLTDANMRR